MRLISVEVLMQVLKEQDLDNVYALLERHYMEEPLVFINSNGEAIFTPYDPLELWDYLEKLYDEIIKEVEL